METYLNILASYAYLGKTKNFTEYLASNVQNGTINLMIDSGAFTKFNAVGDFSHITLDSYCTFLEKYGKYAKKYVQLDEVGNEKVSKANFELMLKRGLKPMFVATMFDKDYEYMKSAVSYNQDLCVAGGVTTKGIWMSKRFQDVYKHTKGRIHGLGYVTYPKIFQLPLASVDSSSWLAGVRFGTCQYYENGIKVFNNNDVTKTKIPVTARRLLEEIKVTPSMMLDKKNFCGAKSISGLCGCKAWMDFSKVAKKNGLDLYLACATESNARMLIWAYENRNDLSFERFKKEV